MTAALLRFQGVNLKPLASLKTSTVRDYGNYLVKNDSSVSIPVFLEDFVYEFKLNKSSDLAKGDYCLTIELHDLKSSDLTITVKTFPIWIFWYKPSESIIDSASHYINKNSHDYTLGILFYLQTSPDITKSFAEIEQDIDREIDIEMIAENTLDNSDFNLTQERNVLLHKIPNPIELKNFTPIVNYLAQEIIKPLAEVVK